MSIFNVGDRVILKSLPKWQENDSKLYNHLMKIGYVYSVTATRSISNCSQLFVNNIPVAINDGRFIAVPPELNHLSIDELNNRADILDI